MEYYDLKSFGESIKNRRNSLGLTLNDISDRTGVNYETIGRIENGKVIPKMETLELLSIHYKMDLIWLLSTNYRAQDGMFFLMKKINPFFYSFKNDFEELIPYVDRFKELNKKTQNIFYKLQFKQIRYILEGIVLLKVDNKIHESFKKFIDSITLFTPEFTLENYYDFVYIDMDILAFTYIARILCQHNGNVNLAIDILEFILKKWYPFHNLYQIVALQLSEIYIDISKIDLALITIENAIEKAIKFKNYDYVNRLYFNKGLCEYLLDIDNYKLSFTTSLIISKTFKKNDFYNTTHKFISDYEIDIKIFEL